MERRFRLIFRFVPPVFVIRWKLLRYGIRWRCESSKGSLRFSVLSSFFSRMTNRLSKGSIIRYIPSRSIKTLDTFPSISFRQNVTYFGVLRVNFTTFFSSTRRRVNILPNYSIAFGPAADTQRLDNSTLCKTFTTAWRICRQAKLRK